MLDLTREEVKAVLRRHPNDCLSCPKTAGRCELQKLTHLYNIDIKEREVRQLPVDSSSPSIIRDENKCIGCEKCIETCGDIQGIGIFDLYKNGDDSYAVTKTGKPMAQTGCINCGQCVKVCPVAALTEKMDLYRTLEAIHDPEKQVVFQMAPAIQNIIGEEFGLEPGKDLSLIMAAAMKQLGGKAFSTDFAADVTIMEEGTELIKRMQGQGALPMFTSCCPAWVKYAEINYPALLSHLSTAKSPQQIFGTLVKTYYAKANKIDPECLFHVSIMPCTAKKFEMSRREMETDQISAVDAVLTAREAADLFKMLHIDLSAIESAPMDSLMGLSSGAGRIFANTGGVMEAALRTISHTLTGELPQPLEFSEVRGMAGIKSSQICLGSQKVSVCIVNGIGNVKPVLDEVAKGCSPYDFIEVMACPGGCINGGGTPIKEEDLPLRMAGIYESDTCRELRLSHENEEVKKLYDDFLGEPCSEKAHHLLHTCYTDRSELV